MQTAERHRTTWPRSTSSALFRSSRPLRVHSTNSGGRRPWRLHCDYVAITFRPPSQRPPGRRAQESGDKRTGPTSNASAVPVRNGCDPPPRGSAATCSLRVPCFPDFGDRTTDVTRCSDPSSVSLGSLRLRRERPPIVFRRRLAAINRRPHSDPTTTATTVAAHLVLRLTGSA